MPRITGRVQIIVNGELLLNKEGAVASGIGPNGVMPVEREEVLGDNELHGFKEVPQVAMCEVTITDRDDKLLSDLLSLTDCTVIFRSTGGGKRYVIYNAFSTGIGNLTAGDGETPIVFKGSRWDESIQG